MRLNFNFNKLLNQIEVYLPKLQYFWFDYIDSVEEVTEMVDILSPLSKLQTIVLHLESDVLFRKIKKEIAEKCGKVRTIKIYAENYSWD